MLLTVLYLQLNVSKWQCRVSSNSYAECLHLGEMKISSVRSRRIFELLKCIHKTVKVVNENVFWSWQLSTAILKNVNIFFPSIVLQLPSGKFLSQFYAEVNKMMNTISRRNPLETNRVPQTSNCPVSISSYSRAIEKVNKLRTNYIRDVKANSFTGRFSSVFFKDSKVSATTNTNDRWGFNYRLRSVNCFALTKAGIETAYGCAFRL